MVANAFEVFNLMRVPGKYPGIRPDQELVRQVEGLSGRIAQDLRGRKSITRLAKEYVQPLFQFRILAFIWLNEQEAGLKELFDQMQRDLQSRVPAEALLELHENVKFALRISQKVVDGLLADASEDVSVRLKEAEKLVGKTYGELLLELQATAGPFYAHIKEFMDTSLFLEFSLIAAYIVEDHKLDLGTRRIAELAEFVADQAQTYGAHAKMLNKYPDKRTRRVPREVFQDSDNYVQEQKALADAGLAIYLNTLFRHGA
jgi:hypothetical protein